MEDIWGRVLGAFLIRLESPQRFDIVYFYTAELINLIQRNLNSIPICSASPYALTSKLKSRDRT
jgi:hypothetical protein